MAEGSETVEMPGSSTTEEVPSKSEVEVEEVKKLMDSDKDETLKTALNALVQGKRHLLVKDLTHACSALGDACRMLSEIYGPISSEHADAHLYYGKALLEQARQDLTVFQAPGPDGKDDEEDTDEDAAEDAEDGNEEGDEDEEAENEEGDNEETKEEEVANGEAEAAAAVPEEAEAEAVPVEEDLSTASPKPGPSTDNEQPSTSKGITDNDETNNEDELGNLELAWEVFEIAKLGFAKQLESLEENLKEVAEDKKSEVTAQCTGLKKKIADTHSYLGEVSIESEMYDRANEDFKTAISIYTEMGDPNSREIAQCYFHIGIANGLAQNFQGSVESLEQAVAILEGRVKNHKEKMEELSKAENPDKEAIEKLEIEIKDLEELIPELKTRINDTLDQEKESKKTAEEEKMEVEIMERSSPVKNPNPPAANDISHLVKKRKKIEEPAAPSNGSSNGDHGESEPPSKKACTSVEDVGTVSSTNGHSTTNGDAA